MKNSFFCHCEEPKLRAKGVAGSVAIPEIASGLMPLAMTINTLIGFGHWKMEFLKRVATGF